MMKSWVGLGILLMGVVFFLGSCGGGAVEDPQEMQIRSYEVPKGQDASQLRDFLRGSLATGDQKLGTVRASPDGSLAVTAPASVHEGIEDLLAQMAKRGPAEPEPAPASITLDYWFLVGRPQEGGGLTVASPTLRQNADLQPVLSEIVSAQGGMEFHLLEQLRLKSLDNGTTADIRGRRVSAGQKVMGHDSGERLADISVTIHGSRGVQHTLQSRIKLEPDRFVVLGQTAYNGRGENIAGLDGPSEDLMLYYVISSEID